MKSEATAAHQTNLVSDVARLTVDLRNAENAARNPADEVIAGLRSQLSEKQQALIAVEEAEASTQRRAQAADALRNAEQAIELAKNELNHLRAEYSALPARIRAAEFRFDQALKAASVAKQNLEVH
jgi:hypothetical protein